MELEALEGNIIGIISNDYEEEKYRDKTVKEILVKKVTDSLKMVNLDSAIVDKDYDDLSSREKSLVKIAAKLQQKTIVLTDITKGLLKKDIDYIKILLKRIEKYNRKIILIDMNAYLFLNCVDKIYVINNEKIEYETDTLYDEKLAKYIDLPKIVEFNQASKINQYTDFDDLLKAIYRIKS